MRSLLICLWLMSLLLAATANGEEASAAPQGEQKFLDKYPHLKDNTYKEPPSGFELGVSLGLLGLSSQSMYFTFNFFQISYVTPKWDSEVLSVGYGVTSTSAAYLQSDHFTLRTVPKYRWNDVLSVGGVFGYEFVSFPNAPSQIYKNGQTTQPEPFSSAGPIYGLAASQNIKLESGTQLKLTEVAYQQTYSTTDAGQGWSYLYLIPALRSDNSSIHAGLVIAIEVGFYY